jgi:zinc-ribbon domain
MASMPQMTDYPRVAYILTLIGGIFFLLGAIVFAIVAAIFGSLISSVLPGLGAVLIAIGVLGIILALIVIFGAIKMRSNPSSAKTWGVIVLVLGLIGLFSGAGYYLGPILTIVGGILAMIWHPTTTGAPAWGQPQQMTMGAAPMGAPPAAGGRTCASCGSANAAGAQFCAKCGAPMGSA